MWLVFMAEDLRREIFTKRSNNMFFKNKDEKIEKEKPKSVGTLDMLDKFAEPFKVDKYNSTPATYVIKVYRIDTAEWDHLMNCSSQIIGVKNTEYRRLIKEMFNADEDRNSFPVFNNIEDAQKAIDAFKPYYETYHVPRSIIERLSFYDEGGYPPTHLLPYVGEVGKNYKTK